MQINPSKARIVRDIKNYRSKIAKDADVRKEVKEHLKKKDSVKYANPSDADIVKGDVYRDFASFQGKNKPSDQAILPNRLGGKLDGSPPADLGSLPPPDPKNTPVNWTSSDYGKLTVDILPNGAVVHTKNGKEIEEAHHYMHGIFNIILYETRRLLDDINYRLDKYAEKYSEADPATAEAGAYLTAVNAFNDYCGTLQTGGSSPYSGAFNFVGIDPVVTNEGFIVSCRVKLNWKNPYHSSSTITIP